MSSKRNKIIYLVATGLLTAFMSMTVGMYIFNNEMVSEVFTKLGYPTYIIYPLAITKILGLIAIWTKKTQHIERMGLCWIFL